MPKETQEQVSKCCGADIITTWDSSMTFVISHRCAKCDKYCEPALKEVLPVHDGMNPENELDPPYAEPYEPVANPEEVECPECKGTRECQRCNGMGQVELEPASPEPAVVKPENFRKLAYVECFYCTEQWCCNERFEAGQKKLPSAEAIKDELRKASRWEIVEVNTISPVTYLDTDFNKAAAAILELWRGE